MRRSLMENRLLGVFWLEVVCWREEVKVRFQYRKCCISARLCIDFSLSVRCFDMKTTICIDDRLMAEALTASGCTTKDAAVEEGLKLLIRLSNQQDLRKLRGTVKWDGNLDESRESR